MKKLFVAAGLIACTMSADKYDYDFPENGVYQAGPVTVEFDFKEKDTRFRRGTIDVKGKC